MGSRGSRAAALVLEAGQEAAKQLPSGGPRQGLVGGHGAGTTSEIVLKLSYVLYFIVYFGLYKFYYIWTPVCTINTHASFYTNWYL